LTPVTTTQSVPLAERTTLRLGGPAARFVHATTAAELVEAVRTADAADDEKVLVLGGGSNLVPTGGVNLQTAKDFIRAGASALGIGADLVDLQALRRGDAELVTERARKFLSLVAEARAEGPAS